MGNVGINYTLVRILFLDNVSTALSISNFMTVDFREILWGVRI